MFEQGILLGALLGWVHWTLFVRSVKLVTSGNAGGALQRVTLALSLMRTVLTLTVAILLVRSGMGTPGGIALGLLCATVGYRIRLHSSSSQPAASEGNGLS